MKQTEKTKDKIAGACLELLNATPLEALRTQDILEKAGVSRSSFYRHFPDKFEVANWIYRRQVEKAVHGMPALRNWKEWTVAEHDYIRRHKRFFRNIAGYRGQNSFEEYLCRYFTDNVMKFRRNRGEEMTEEQRYAVRRFSLIAARSTVEWILNDFQPDDATLIRLNEACIPPCIRPFYE